MMKIHARLVTNTCGFMLITKRDITFVILSWRMDSTSRTFWREKMGFIAPRLIFCTSLDAVPTLE